MGNAFRSILGDARPALLAAAVGFLVGAATPPMAAGHAFGSFSISVFSQLTVADRQVRIRWVVDMAELPAGVVVELIDTDSDGVTTEIERTAYVNVWISSVLQNLELQVDGVDLPLEVVSSELSFPLGEGGSPSLRVVADLVARLAPLHAADVHEATYRDTNYIEYIGWREVAVAVAEGVRLIESSVPLEGRTQELTVYPADLGMSVPSSEAQFTFSLAAPASASPGSSISGQGLESAAPSFKWWPTGVLAVLVVVGVLGLAAVTSDRPAPRGRRR
jgi:hypothetical protein